MSTDDITDELTRNVEGTTQERLPRLFFFICAAVSVVTTVSIVVLLATEAARFFSVTAPLVGFAGETVDAADFFLKTAWQPPEQFGVLALVSATILITVGSAIVAIPHGVGTAI